MMAGLFISYLVCLFLILRFKTTAFFLIIINIILGILLVWYQATEHLRVQL